MASEEAIEQHVFEPNGGVPNSRLPLLIRRDALPSEALDAIQSRRLLERSGWTGTWVYSVFPFWHFHTKGHEVLACISGTALLGFGGDAGVEAKIEMGDVCLIPAGVGHRRIESSDDFLVAGGYPPGQDGDIVRPGEMADEAIDDALRCLEVPETDPLSGRADGMVAVWRYYTAA